MGLNIGLQITRKCNLRCAHCSVSLDACDMSLDVFRTVVAYAEKRGGAVGLTGGEPLLHPHIDTFVHILAGRGLKFAIVSNGWHFPAFYMRLRESLGTLRGVYLSVDGATAETHDANRGDGAYRRVLTAAAFCKAVDIPFTLQMIVTRRNMNELERLALLGAKLGARGVNVGPVQPTPEGADNGLVLSPSEMRFVIDEVARLKAVFRMPIEPGVGFFCDDPMVLCDPLTAETLFVNADGKAGFCCVLADYREGGHGDLVGDVRAETMESIHLRMAEQVAQYKRAKAHRVERKRFGALDHANCWYCLKHFGKVSWLSGRDVDPWSDDIRLWEKTDAAADDPGTTVVRSPPSHGGRWCACADAETIPLPREEAVLVNVGTALSYRLNRTGLRIWEGVRSAHDVGAIARLLAQEFDVEESVARDEVGAFLDQLRTLGFVQPEENRP